MTELSFPALLIIKSSVVLLMGAATAAILRKSSASSRYAAWALAFAVILALPAGMLLGPAWRVKVAEAPAIVNSPRVLQAPSAAETVPMATTTSPRIEVTSSMPIEQKLLIGWMIGTALLLLRMILAQVSLSRIVARAELLRESEWLAPLERGITSLEIEREVLLYSSNRVSTPLTAGILRPFIIVPADADTWDAEHREIVLRHELAHIARVDAFVCILSGIACSIYWFNPLAWLAYARMKSEQERSCDDRVIMLGTPPVEYASHLLEVARSARSIGMSSFVSVAMARPTQLEGRLLAVLNDRRRDSLTRTRSAGAVMVALLLVLAVSALRPVRAESAVIVASQTAPVFVTAEKPAPEPKATQAVDSTVSGDVRVESGGTLVLDLKPGAGVTIRGTNENRVRVNGRLGGKDWRITTFDVRGNGRDAFVTMDYLRNGNTSTSHSLNITVPRRFNVRISSSGGQISITDVEGTFTGHTGGGEITIENARGRADLSTGGGEVDVRDSHLSGQVSTGGGEVIIRNVTGGLNGSSGTMGSGIGSGVSGRVSGDVKGDVVGGQTATVRGDVIVDRYPSSEDDFKTTNDGRYSISKSGGAVNMETAPNGASIRTGGGEINIGRTNGDFYAQTGGGDVTVGAADGAVEIVTGAGDVEINVTEVGHPIKIASGNGRVTLILPRNMSADLDLETGYTRQHGPTRIRSDWSVSTTETDQYDSSMGTPRRYVRTQQSIGGGGARIRVRTTNGDIVLKRR